MTNFNKNKALNVNNPKHNLINTMKKITLLLLFLSFISVLQAQITPDGTTNTTTSDAGGVIIIDIAVPNASGLSNNTYTDFNISNSGIILNNSAASLKNPLPLTVRVELHLYSQ